MDFSRTQQYFESTYVINNPQGRVLRLGDFVIVHPTEKSTMREPYPGVISKAFINWAVNPGFEIIMTAMNGYKYSAVLNDYCFSRLEPVKWMYHKDLMKRVKVEGFKIVDESLVV